MKPESTRTTGPKPHSKPIRDIVAELLRRHHDVLVTADRLPITPKPKGGRP